MHVWLLGMETLALAFMSLFDTVVVISSIASVLLCTRSIYRALLLGQVSAAGDVHTAVVLVLVVVAAAAAARVGKTAHFCRYYSMLGRDQHGSPKEEHLGITDARFSTGWMAFLVNRIMQILLCQFAQNSLEMWPLYRRRTVVLWW